LQPTSPVLIAIALRAISDKRPMCGYLAAQQD
jgi:hypothetical protein